MPNRLSSGLLSLALALAGPLANAGFKVDASRNLLTTRERVELWSTEDDPSLPPAHPMVWESSHGGTFSPSGDGPNRMVFTPPALEEATAILITGIQGEARATVTLHVVPSPRPLALELAPVSADQVEIELPTTPMLHRAPAAPGERPGPASMPRFTFAAESDHLPAGGQASCGCARLCRQALDSCWSAVRAWTQGGGATNQVEAFEGVEADGYEVSEAMTRHEPSASLNSRNSGASSPSASGPHARRSPRAMGYAGPQSPSSLTIPGAVSVREEGARLRVTPPKPRAPGTAPSPNCH